MRRPILAGLMVASLAFAGCASITNKLGISHADETKALTVATQSMDAAINSAEAAHQTGLLIGDNWTTTKGVLAKMQNVLVLAQASYVAGNQGDTEAQLQAFAALIPQVQSLIANRGASQ